MNNLFLSISKISATLLLVLSVLCLCSCTATQKEPLNAMDYINALVEAEFPVENIVEKPADSEYLNYIERFLFADSRTTQYNDEFPIGGEIQIYETKELMNEALDKTKGLYGSVPNVAMRLYPAPDGLAILLIEYELSDAQAEEYKIAFESFCKNRKITKKFEGRD